MKKGINLKNKDSKTNRSSKTTLSGTILLVLLFIFGIIFGLNLIVEKKINAVKNEAEKLERSFADQDFKDAYNFGISLISLNKLVEKEGFLPQTVNVIRISEKTLPEVHFSSLDIKSEEGAASFSFDLIAPNSEVLVKQIKIYKELEGVRNVFFEEVSSLDDKEGYAEGSVTTKVNFMII
jgi:hypothetical protein